MMPELTTTNKWKAVYSYRASIKFVWDPEASSPLISISEDGRVATQVDVNRNHCDVVANRSFKSGKHSWSIRCDDLDNKYWIGLGVITRKHQKFTYRVQTIFGQASNGRALAPSWRYIRFFNRLLCSINLSVLLIFSFVI